MKKVKEYLATLKWNLIGEDTAVEGVTIKHVWILESDAEKLIKQCQIDAIEATVLKCSQDVRVLPLTFDGCTGKFNIDKQSIIDIGE